MPLTRNPVPRLSLPNSQLDPDNPSHNPVAEQLSNQLFTLLSNKANELNKLSRTFPQAQVGVTCWVGLS